MTRSNALSRALTLTVLATLTACGGGGGGRSAPNNPPNNPPDTPPNRTIGGTVSGLSGSGLALQNNGGDNLTISGNGAFTFATSIANGSQYAVTALTQPTNPAQTCAIAGGSGTATANVTSVAVTCTTDTTNPPDTNRTISGTVSGLSGAGLVLQNNGGDNLTITGNGAFTFATAIAGGSQFAVTALAQPTNPSQTCAVANGSGTATDNVASVAITCTTDTFNVRATVSGLTGTGLVLGNAADRVIADANDTFTFDTPVASGARYNVVVEAAPTPAQLCTVADGNGAIANADVEITVTCVGTAPTFAYELDKADATLTSYAVNAATGQLRPRLSVKTGDSPATALTYKSSNGNQFSYVLNTGSDNISAFAVDGRSGDLNEVVGSPFATGAEPTLLVLHPKLPVVYATNKDGASITAFTINTSTGALTSLGTVATGTTPQSFNIDASGRFAYVAAPGSSELFTYAINQTSGALSEVAGSRVAIGSSFGGVAMERDSNYLYVFNPTPGTISAFALNGATGVPSTLAGSPIAAGANIRFLGMHPNGKFVYAKRGPLTQAEAHGVAVFALNAADGSLGEIAGSPFDVSANPANPLKIGFDPSGQYLYTSNLLIGTPVQSDVRAYSIDATSGALSVVTGSPLASDLYPEELAVDSTGKFLYTSNGTAHMISAYGIDSSDGSLSPLPSSPVSAGDQPGLITVAEDATPLQASSKFVYATDATNDAVLGFTIGANGTLTAGTLTALAPTTVNSPLGITLDPKGHYAYAASPTTNTIHIYSVASQTGVLTETGGPVAVTAGAPQYVSIEPTGRFAYVSVPTANQIVKYAIDGGTGGLSSPVVTPVTGQDVTQLLITPNGRWLVASTASSTQLSSYRIDPNNGDLLDFAPVPAIDPVDSLAVDPSGKYVFATSASTGYLRVLAINAQSGALSPANAFLFTGGGGPRGVATDASGELVFTTNFANDEVNMFQVGGNGGLTPLSSTGITKPIAVTTDYSGKFVYVTTAAGQLQTLSVDRDTDTMTLIDTDVIGAASAPGTIVTSSHTE